MIKYLNFSIIGGHGNINPFNAHTPAYLKILRLHIYNVYIYYYLCMKYYRELNSGCQDITKKALK